MALTLSEARDELTKARNAYDLVRQGQRFTKADRTLTMADLSELRADVQYWERRVDELEAQDKGRSSIHSVATFK